MRWDEMRLLVLYLHHANFDDWNSSTRNTPLDFFIKFVAVFGEHHLHPALGSRAQVVYSEMSTRVQKFSKHFSFPSTLRLSKHDPVVSHPLAFLMVASSFP